MSASAVSEHISDLLADFPEISLVYLFGSQVTGQTGPLSDYDLAVLLDAPADWEHTLARLAHALTVRLHTDRVNIVLLNRTAVELAYHVIATGSLLYQRDVATRVEYEAQVLSRYGDYLPVLRAQRSQILQGEPHAKRIQRYRTALRRTRRALSPPAAPAKQTPR